MVGNTQVLDFRACQLQAYIFLSSTDKVAEGILELITDTSKSGAVMTATLTKGLKYQRLFGDPPVAKL